MQFQRNPTLRKIVLLLVAASFCSNVAFSRSITDEQCANVVKAFGSMDLFMLLAAQNDKMIDDILKEFGAPETSQQSALERNLRQQLEWYKMKRSSLSRAHSFSGHSKMQIRELCGPPSK